MKKVIKLRESELRRMITESVRNIIRGMQLPARRPIREQYDNPNMEYDWEEFEEDPEYIKDIENNASWNTKNAADDESRELAHIDIEQGPYKHINYDKHAVEYWDPYWNNQKGWGDAPKNDYFNDSDYRFKHNGWERSSSHFMDNHETFRDNPDRFYKNESKLRKHIAESLRRLLNEHR